MRHTAYSGPLFLALILSAFTPSPLAHAQAAPAAGTSISVKMVEAIDSSIDPAGKQYRASVTKAVDAGNGLTIPQGATAAVTLARGGTGWTTQLASVTINGQVVAVASGSANVTSSAQAAAGSTMNAVSSVLGGFGRHVNPPPAVAAVATGQRVVLPPGITLTFVLAKPPTTAAGPPAAQTIASAAPASKPASASESTSVASIGGSLTAMEICFSNAPNAPGPNHGNEFLTAAFETPVANLRSVPVIEPAFSAYLKSAYNYSSAGITCQPIFSIPDAQQAQKKIIDDRDRGKLKMINTGWRYGQPPVTQGQSGFDPLAPGQGGLDLTQHRLTTYFCALTAAGGTIMAVDMTKPNWNANMTTYVSQVFQADWDPAPVSMAYKVFIRDNYVHDLVPSADLSPRCGAQSPAMQAGMHQTEMISNKRIGHAVPVDFSYTPAQAAAGNVVGAQAAAATQAAAAQAAAATFFISCSTSGNAGVDTYYTGVFQIGAKPGRSPHPPNAPGAYIGGTWMVPAVLSQTVLDHFYAYLTQKGYKYSPGSSSACDIARTEAATKAAQHKRAYEGGGCSSCGKTVETGWKDQ